MSRWTVYTEKGDYRGVVAENEWSAKREVQRETGGRERIVCAVREG